VFGVFAAQPGFPGRIEFFGTHRLSEPQISCRFAGGDGRVRLRGTNQPDLVGADVSHGCVRSGTSPSGVARILQHGVPVDFQA
jgi:hypothetical protein